MSVSSQWLSVVPDIDQQWIVSQWQLCVSCRLSAITDALAWLRHCSFVFDKTSRQNVPQDKWGPLPNMGDHWPPNLIFNNWINSEWGEIRREYSKTDVKKYLEVWLSWTGNPRYILSKNPRDSLWNGVSLQQKTILHFPGFFCWKLHWWGLHWTLSG